MRLKQTTSEDIARLAGVSRASVSYVLNGRADARISPETRTRILKAAREAGYQPNRLATALSTGRIHTVGIVTPTRGLIGGQRVTYSQDLFLEISLAASLSKMNAMIFMEPLVTEKDGPVLGLRPADLCDGRVDGVIVFGEYERPDWVRAVSESGLPCVEIGSSWGNVSVHADNRGGIRAAAEHLLALGHRRIAYWTPDRDFPSVVARRDEFRRAMCDGGLSEPDTPVIASETAEELAALLRQQERPTALMTYNDQQAVVALDILRGLGLRVPQDVSLIGFDDDLRAVTVWPRLTTVAVPLKAMAQAAMDRLMDQIERNTLETSPLFVPTQLIVRESTAPFKGES